MDFALTEECSWGKVWVRPRSCSRVGVLRTAMPCGFRGKKLGWGGDYFFSSRNNLFFVGWLNIISAGKEIIMAKVKIRDMVVLGSFIKKRRKFLRLRIDDTAALCGVAVSTLSAMENGSRPIGVEKLLLVLKGLGIELFISDGKE